MQAAQAGSVAGSTAAAGLEEGLWLCPVEDRRRLDSSREGMLEGFSLGNYLLLVEYTGRLFGEGKAVISGELDGIFERLGSNAENWQARLQKLAAGRLLRRFFAASRARLREVAERLGVHHLANLGGSRCDDAAPKAGLQARLHFTWASQPHQLNRRHASSTCRGRGRGLPTSASWRVRSASTRAPSTSQRRMSGRRSFTLRSRLCHQKETKLVRSSQDSADPVVN